MSEHAPLPPSSAGRWAAQCTGSAQMEARYPETEPSASALDGVAAHAVADRMFRGLPVRIGEPVANGIVITEEMIEAAEAYNDDVIGVLGNDSSRAHIEETVGPLAELPDNWGTPDLWHFTPGGHNGGLLLVWDFKFGHRFVDAFENWQMINYIMLILDRPEFAGLDPAHISVIMTVVQPRNYHPIGIIRRWETTVAALQPYFERLKSSATLALSASASTRVGPECQDCKARHACEALMIAAQEAMDTAGGTASIDLPASALGVELRMLQRSAKLIEARITGLEAQATGMIRAGERVPFFALEQGDGREVWTKPVEEVLALGTLFGKNLAKPTAPITPNQARKAGIDAAVISSYSDRPKGALKLVPEDTRQARKVFGK